jgi:quercetin dioxygenase-like cupin family protein
MLITWRQRQLSAGKLHSNSLETQIMAGPYVYFADVAAEVEPPVNGTLSRTLYQDDLLKVVLFGFAAGQELSEHTASTPAIMQFLRGEADVTLGADHVVASSGTWVHMPAQLPHSVRAKTSTVMLLLLLKVESAER